MTRFWTIIAFSLCLSCLTVGPATSTSFGVSSIFQLKGRSQIHTCVELFPGGTARPPLIKGTGKSACFWHTKRLTVRFLEGDPRVQAKVRSYATLWTQYSG